MHLPVMKHYRVTSTGRRLSAEPRVRIEPDMKTLVALVLHLAGELHTVELAGQQPHVGEGREDGHNDTRPTSGG